MSENTASPPRVEIVQTCPGVGFSMTGDALTSVGRQDVLIPLSTPETLAAAARPVLVIPAAGTWNLLPSDQSQGAVGMLERARQAIGSLDNLTIALDCGGEGFAFSPDIHAAFAQEMARLAPNASRCFIITSRTDGREGYAQWCRQTSQAPLFIPVYSPIQLYFFAGRYRDIHDLANLSRLITQRNPGLSGLRPRKFVCLNFMPRDNRWAMVLRLMNDGVIDQGFVSFQGRSQDVAQYEDEVRLDSIKQQLRSLGIPEAHIARVDELDAMAPLELDEAKVSRFDKAYGLADQSYYGESYFSIVTESDFMGYAGRRFSEKVLKPIANLQPFVTLGTVGTMAELRRLGFQTFSPFIDESYDEIEDPAVRLQAGIEAAMALVHLGPDDLHALYAELWPRLVHNYIHFLCATPRLVDQDEALLALSAPG